MNPNELAKKYSCLSAEERFRLILAAGARGDDVEQKRLMVAGRSIVFSVQDHAPFAQAFSEVARVVYLELLETAHQYEDAFDRAEEASAHEGDAAADDEEGSYLEPESDEAELDQACSEPSVADRYFDLVLAKGYELRATADGWQLFCQRLSVPPYATWKHLPGFERLERSLSLAQKAAFVPEGFLRWLNSNAPPGEPLLTSVPISAEGIAEATETIFREQVAWWGGN